MGTVQRVRAKAGRAVSRARTTRPWRALRPVTARSVYVVDENGAPLLERRPDLPVHGRSTIKLLTAATARDLLDPDQGVLVHQADEAPHSVARPGQTWTVADLLTSCLEHSDNTATAALARTAGPGFLDAMRAAAPAGWVITDSRGFGQDNRVTARGMVDLLRRIADTDPWLHDQAGRATHGIPGYVAGKSGSHGLEPSGEAHLVWSWRRPDGSTATAAVMGTDVRNRPLDVAALQRRIG